MANTNKFTRSVLERLEQENKKQTQAPEKQKTSPKEKMVTEKTEIEPVSLEKNEPIRGLDQFLSVTESRKAKNKTFYLDEIVIETLTKAAKERKMTDSKLCNDILRAVLEIKD